MPERHAVIAADAGQQPLMHAEIEIRRFRFRLRLAAGGWRLAAGGRS
jgi:hypothetical protein